MAPSKFGEGLSRCCAWICKVHIRIEPEHTTRCWLGLSLGIVADIPYSRRAILRTCFVLVKTPSEGHCENLTSSRDAIGLLHECSRDRVSTHQSSELSGTDSFVGPELYQDFLLGLGSKRLRQCALWSCLSRVFAANDLYWTVSPLKNKKSLLLGSSRECRSPSSLLDRLGSCEFRDFLPPAQSLQRRLPCSCTGCISPEGSRDIPATDR